MGERPFGLDLETWRARVASLARSLEDKNTVAVDRDAVERRFNEAAARVADALPADLAAALARAAALAPSCAASVGWLARRDATRAAEDGTARFEAILGAVVAETRATRRETTRSTKKNAFRSGTDGARVAESNAASEIGEDAERFSRVDCHDVLSRRSRTRTRRRSCSCAVCSASTTRATSGTRWSTSARAARRRGSRRRRAATQTTKANADALCAEILAFADDLGADTAGNQRRVVLVGHSKGGVDACAALALHEHRLKDIVLGVITVQSPYGGSPVASDLTATPAMRSLTERALEVLLRAPKGVGSKNLLPALLDVTYEKRMAFLEHHPLPCRFPCVSFHSAVKSPSGILALGAAYVKNRYGSDNDGLVCGLDAEVPGCVAVRYGADYDHADGAYPRFMSDERYRRYVENISPDGEKEGFESNAFEQKDVED
jgi:pimeloyl-ACP methyl ester carboxylesterase